MADGQMSVHLVVQKNGAGKISPFGLVNFYNFQFGVSMSILHRLFSTALGPILVMMVASTPVASAEPLELPLPFNPFEMSFDDRLDFAREFVEQVASEFYYDSSIVQMTPDGRFWGHYYCQDWSREDVDVQIETVIDAYRFTDHSIIVLDPGLNMYGCASNVI